MPGRDSFVVAKLRAAGAIFIGKSTLGELGAGDVTLKTSAGEQRYNVNWGFVEVLGDRVTILASDALKPAEIDVKRAQEQLDRGHAAWKQAGDSEEAYTEALRVIAEAEAKLASASPAKH